jgi:4-hydroxy-2-oxoheptanedioate aldolase
MIENSILRKSREGKKALVLAMKSPAPFAVELAAHAGFDAVHLDGQHGAWDAGSLDAVCRIAHACGMSVGARVPNIEYATIGRYLDAGVQSITAPNVDTPAQAQAVADAARFPPLGRRSFGGCRGTSFGDPVAADRHGGKRGFMEWLNANIGVVVQIESRRGWENLDGILAVEGLDGVALGPNDLAADLGHPGEPEHPDCRAAIEDVERRARAAGKLARANRVTMLDLDSFLLRGLRDFIDARRGEPAD